MNDPEFLKRCIRRCKALGPDMFEDVFDACEMNEIGPVELANGSMSSDEAADKLFLMSNEAEALMVQCKHELLRIGHDFKDGSIYQPQPGDDGTPDPAAAPSAPVKDRSSPNKDRISPNKKQVEHASAVVAKAASPELSPPSNVPTAPHSVVSHPKASTTPHPPKSAPSPAAAVPSPPPSKEAAHQKTQPSPVPKPAPSLPLPTAVIPIKATTPSPAPTPAQASKSTPVSSSKPPPVPARPSLPKPTPSPLPKPTPSPIAHKNHLKEPTSPNSPDHLIMLPSPPVELSGSRLQGRLAGAPKAKNVPSFAPPKSTKPVRPASAQPDFDDSKLPSYMKGTNVTKRRTVDELVSTEEVNRSHTPGVRTSQTSLYGPARAQQLKNSETEAEKKPKSAFAHISSSLLRPTQAFLAWASGSDKKKEDLQKQSLGSSMVLTARGAPPSSSGSRIPGASVRLTAKDLPAAHPKASPLPAASPLYSSFDVSSTSAIPRAPTTPVTLTPNGTSRIPSFH